MNRLRLKQLRKSIKTMISHSPTKITIERVPLIQDPFDEDRLIPDPEGTPTIHPVKCRLSHERSIVPDTQQVPSGLSTNLERFIIVAHDAEIYEGDTFDALDKSWKIGPIDPLVKFGGVYGYQAPLIEAEDTNANT